MFVTFFPQHPSGYMKFGVRLWGWVICYISMLISLAHQKSNTSTLSGPQGSRECPTLIVILYYFSSSLSCALVSGRVTAALSAPHLSLEETYTLRRKKPNKCKYPGLDPSPSGTNPQATTTSYKKVSDSWIKTDFRT